MAQFTTQMCACTDLDCARRVQDEYKVWIRDNTADQSGVSEANEVKVRADFDKQNECATGIVQQTLAGGDTTAATAPPAGASPGSDDDDDDDDDDDAKKSGGAKKGNAATCRKGLKCCRAMKKAKKGGNLKCPRFKKITGAECDNETRALREKAAAAGVDCK